MGKKIGITVGLLLVILSTVMNINVLAASPNVKDCMEGNADCVDLDGETPDKQQKSEDDQANPSIGNDNGSLVFEFVKMGFALLIVVALIYLVLKFLNKRNRLFSRVKALENLGGISVGPNKSIQIVRIGKKMYLIGVGENVEMLQEITDEEVKNDLLHHNEGQNERTMPSLFLTKNDEARTGETEKRNEFKRLFTTELEKLKEGRKKLINQSRQKEDKHE
ncbi:flagellar biosynthetic protein FliZ [Lentibacillus populi]|uniref:Flagellar biosynthetic protein FliZ n=1 Tax=Lentibacillus populi TaxID=1827502 RepID=A0A9W5X409_9BACI|nr:MULTISPECIES: flagellar biosynthetic protein FliO [Bacillaceae]MBT2216663.1 flagellar biosynthetic protein FliO [Virgibacillus dakarensis]GGB30382.1 flagellar biosynthetic protein FliZ [Lentibacillus populi]